MSNFDIKIELPDIDVKSNSTLKISIASTWTANEFSQLLRSMDILYKSKFWILKILVQTHQFLTDPNKKDIKYSDFSQTPLAMILSSVKSELQIIEGDEIDKRHRATLFSYNDKLYTDTLAVKKISYASPGFTDFFGISGILKEIREAIVYYLPNQKDKEQIEIMRQEKIELQIKNLKAIGFTELEIRKIVLREDVQVSKISNFLAKGMITNAEIIAKGK